MHKHNVIRLLLLLAILPLCYCYGPLDPYNPPPSRRIDPDQPNDPATTFPSGLVAWWPCNDTGRILADSLQKRNGMLIGGSWTSGISGGALQLNGSGDYVAVADHAAFNFGTGDFTISVWVRPQIHEIITDTTRYDIIAKGEVRKNGFGLSVYRNSFNAFVGHYASYSEDTALVNANVWRHCVMLRRAGMVELYVNGTRVHSYPSDFNVSSEGALLIGKDATARRNNFPGIVDEIKIFSKGWTAADVGAEYRRFVIPSP